MAQHTIFHYAVALMEYALHAVCVRVRVSVGGLMTSKRKVTISFMYFPVGHLVISGVPSTHACYEEKGWGRLEK